jgi:hypothetical protein
MLFRLLTGCAILIFSLPASGQTVDVIRDTVPALSDTVFIRKGGKVYTAATYAKRFQPRKALLFAAMVPGLGQIYNRKYWKLPLVYGGIASLTYMVVAYNNRYVKYKGELFSLLADPNFVTTNKYTESQLRTLVDTYRRERDYFLILDGFMYILQMVDAHVDAHLKEFDLNPQLKMSLRPGVQQNPMFGRASGITLTFTF